MTNRASEWPHPSVDCHVLSQGKLVLESLPAKLTNLPSPSLANDEPCGTRDRRLHSICFRSFRRIWHYHFLSHWYLIISPIPDSTAVHIWASTYVKTRKCQSHDEKMPRVIRDTSVTATIPTMHITMSVDFTLMCTFGMGLQMSLLGVSLGAPWTDKWLFSCVNKGVSF